MRNTIHLKIILLICIAGNFSLQAGAQETFSLKNKDITAFREDSVIAFRSLHDFGFLPYSIKQSAAEIEIRYYITGGARFGINDLLIIKYSQNKIYSQLYELDNRYGLIRRFPSQEKINWDSAFSVFMTDNIFAMQDEKMFIDSLREKGTVVINPCGGIDDCFETFDLIEIKAGNMFRNFRISSLNYFARNPTISQFQTWQHIRFLLNHIWMNSYFQYNKPIPSQTGLILQKEFIVH